MVCFVPNATHRLLSTGQLINVGFSLIANKQGTSITVHNKTYFVGKPDIYTPTIQWIEAMIIKPQFKVYGCYDCNTTKATLERERESEDEIGL